MALFGFSFKQERMIQIFMKIDKNFGELVKRTIEFHTENGVRVGMVW